jgi:polysaccharide export outer membrane protein
MIRIQSQITVLTATVLTIGVTAMAAQDTVAKLPSQNTETATSSHAADFSPQLQQRYPRYVIQRQDVLLISFPLSPELNQTVTVQPDGYINLQNAKSLYVKGMTVPETAVALRQAYAGILNSPIITVDVKDFQQPFYTVTGQVQKPGQYVLRADITVAEAIAVAGGLQPSAKSQVFLFHRTSNDWFQVEKLNLKNIFNGKNVNEDAVIKPGDMVFVPENAITKFRKYVPYSLSAGSYLAENQ